MIGCLHDRTLVRLVYEAGSARQRRHLDRCARCSGRHAEFTRARDVATAVLRHAAVRPVDMTVRGGREDGRMFDRRAARVMAPLAAAAALFVALMLGVRVGTRSTARADAAFSLEDVAANAFTFDDAGGWLTADADDLRWQAALRGEWPCETDDGFSDPHCD